MSTVTYSRSLGSKNASGHNLISIAVDQIGNGLVHSLKLNENYELPDGHQKSTKVTTHKFKALGNQVKVMKANPLNPEQIAIGSKDQTV